MKYLVLILATILFGGCFFCSSTIDKPVIEDYDGQVTKWNAIDNLKYPLLGDSTSSLLSIQRIDSSSNRVKILLKNKNEDWPKANYLFVVIERKRQEQYEWFKSYPLVKEYVYHHQGFPFSELIHAVDFSDPSFCLCDAKGNFRISILALLYASNVQKKIIEEDERKTRVIVTVSEHGYKILGRIQSNYVEVTLP